MTAHKTGWLLASLMFLALCPAVASAQSEALDKTYRQGAALSQAGRYGEAVPIWRRTLELGEREFGPDHPNTATFLNNLAGLYYRQGKYAEAEPLHKRSLAIREKVFGAEHPQVAKGLNNLAVV
jgi:tetratricopeptide (TPR) repeat protein